MANIGGLTTIGNIIRMSLFSFTYNMVIRELKIVIRQYITNKKNFKVFHIYD